MEDLAVELPSAQEVLEDQILGVASLEVSSCHPDPSSYRVEVDEGACLEDLKVWVHEDHGVRGAREGRVGHGGRDVHEVREAP